MLGCAGRVTRTVRTSVRTEGAPTMYYQWEIKRETTCGEPDSAGWRDEATSPGVDFSAQLHDLILSVANAHDFNVRDTQTLYSAAAVLHVRPLGELPGEGSSRG